MKKEYIVTEKMGFDADKKIPVIIHKKIVEIENEDGDMQEVEEIDFVEAFESAFSSKTEITKFKKIITEDLEVKKIDFRLISRGNMIPEEERSED